jgi:uncharacterized protein YqgV (UPF0045/DUF77 family)
VEISAEVSLYPLTESYEESVLLFLDRLGAYDNIRFETNGMSTQIFGDSKAVFHLLEVEYCRIQEEGKALLVMKIGPGTLQYEGKYARK